MEYPSFSSTAVSNKKKAEKEKKENVKTRREREAADSAG